MELMNGTIHPPELLVNGGAVASQPRQQAGSMGTHGNSLQDHPSDFSILSQPSSTHLPGSSSASSSHMDQSHLHLQMSYDNLGSDMTLEEAVLRVKELLMENQELRGNIHQTNQAMRGACTTLQEWKDAWEKERREVKGKYEITREVVTKLRGTLQERESKIALLNRQVEELKSRNRGPTPSMEQEMRTQEDRIMDLETTIEEQKVEMLQLKTKLERMELENQKAKDDLSLSKHANQDLQADVAKLKATNEILFKDKAKVEEHGRMLMEANERLQVEKRDLVALNNSLQTELHNCKSLIASSSSENGGGNSQLRDFVMVQQDETLPKASATDDEVLLGTPRTKLETFPGPGGEGGEVTMKGKEEERRMKTKEKREQTVQDLLLQLQEEKDKMADLAAAHHTVIAKLKQKETELHDKEEELARLQQRTAAEFERQQREQQDRTAVLQHQNENLQQQLHACKEAQSSTSQQQDLANMRSQVLSLMNEVKEAQSKKEAAQLASNTHKDRFTEMEQKLIKAQSELQRTRYEDDQLIDTLRISVKSLEVKMENQRKEATQKTSEYATLQKNHKDLLGDYHELVKQFEDQKSEQKQQQEMASLSSSLRRDYETKVDNLTAQLVVAEESLETKKRLIRDLLKQKDALEGQVETIPVHQAQAEVYKIDFEAERKAREDAQHDKELIKTELAKVQQAYQKLKDDYVKLQTNQLGEMQRRHGAPAQQPHIPASTYPPAVTTGNPVYPTYAQAAQFPNPYSDYEQYQRGMDIPPGGFQGQVNYQYPPQYPHGNYSSPSGGGAYGRGDGMVPRQPSSQQPPFGQDMCDDNALSTAGYRGVMAAKDGVQRSEENTSAASSSGDRRASQESSSVRPPAAQTTQIECPKCKTVAPNMEALQEHFVDCLDMDQ